MNKKERYFIVPDIWLKDLSNKQEKILSILKGKFSESDDLGDYVTEVTAKKLFGRKTTWLWQMRKSGELPYSKVGNKIYYMKSDLINLIKTGSEK